MMAGSPRIGELADTVGVDPMTIRHCEDIALQPEPSRSPGGDRTCDSNDSERLGSFRRAHQLELITAHRRGAGQSRAGR